jgi:hypothetical protein
LTDRVFYRLAVDAAARPQPKRKRDYTPGSITAPFKHKEVVAERSITAFAKTMGDGRLPRPRERAETDHASCCDDCAGVQNFLPLGLQDVR